MKYLLSLLLLFCFAFSHADMVIKKTRKNGKTEILEIGDRIRVSYPGAKLEDTKKLKEIVGIFGRITEIKKNSIVVESNKKKELELILNDIISIGRLPMFGSIASFVGTYAIIGVGSMYLVDKADANPALVPLVGAAALVPTMVISSAVFYPSKSKNKVNKDYSIEIINR